MYAGKDGYTWSPKTLPEEKKHGKKNLSVLSAK